MLQRLVASERPRGFFRGAPGAVMSAAVHGLLIAGAVTATRHDPGMPVATPLIRDPMPWVLEPTSEAPPESPPDMPAWPVLDPASADGMADQLIAVPTAVPTGWPWATMAGDASTVVRSALADVPPELLTRPALEYPAALRAAGIEGTVVIEVIVDATGVPEAESFRVVSSAHPGFEAAARRVVLGARFRPGRWRGRPVRVLIRQPVEFRLTG